MSRTPQGLLTARNNPRAAGWSALSFSALRPVESLCALAVLRTRLAAYGPVRIRTVCGWSDPRQASAQRWDFRQSRRVQRRQRVGVRSCYGGLRQAQRPRVVALGSGAGVHAQAHAQAALAGILRAVVLVRRHSSPGNPARRMRTRRCRGATRFATITGGGRVCPAPLPAGAARPREPRPPPGMRSSLPSRRQ